MSDRARKLISERIDEGSCDWPAAALAVIESLLTQTEDLEGTRDHYRDLAEDRARDMATLRKSHRRAELVQLVCAVESRLPRVEMVRERAGTSEYPDFKVVPDRVLGRAVNLQAAIDKECQP